MMSSLSNLWAPRRPAKARVVVVGAGVGSRALLKLLDTALMEVIVIQPNFFSESPFSGPLTIAFPEHHAKFVTEAPVSTQGVTTIYGVPTCVVVGRRGPNSFGGGHALRVRLLRAPAPELDGKARASEAEDDHNDDVFEQDVPFDYLVAATGFRLPTLLPAPGATLRERFTEVAAVRFACAAGAGRVVVGGGGVLAVEVAGNLAEAVNQQQPQEERQQPEHREALATEVSSTGLRRRREGPGVSSQSPGSSSRSSSRSEGGPPPPPPPPRVVLVASSFLPGYSEQSRAQVAKRLEGLGVELRLGDRVASHKEAALARPVLAQQRRMRQREPQHQHHQHQRRKQQQQDREEKEEEEEEEEKLLTLTLESGAALSGVALYLPAFAGAANTDWLRGSSGGGGGSGSDLAGEQVERSGSSADSACVGGRAGVVGDSDGGGGGGGGINDGGGNGGDIERRRHPVRLGAGVLDPQTGQVVLDKHLRCVAFPKLFALGGCAKLAVKESYLGVPKIEAQAKTVARNLRASINGHKLREHAEGLPFVTNAPFVVAGHHTFALVATEALPRPAAWVLTACGSPCDAWLCPCFACGVCAGLWDADVCGEACAAPQGRGVARLLWDVCLSGLPACKVGFGAPLGGEGRAVAALRKCAQALSPPGAPQQGIPPRGRGLAPPLVNAPEMRPMDRSDTDDRRAQSYS